MRRLLRSYRDRDYVKTKENFIFCVVGPTHPRDRVISYIKYLPHPSGMWGKGENKFRRLLRQALRVSHKKPGDPGYVPEKNYEVPNEE